MQEKHIHRLWNTGFFERNSFKCIRGEEVIIHFKGVYNEYSGPDFFGGRITLDGEEWVGNIEMHLRSSDWNRHDHCNDPAYDNVVLHVVWWHDEEVILSNGRVLPTLELATLQFENYKILTFEDSLPRTENPDSALVRANDPIPESSNFRMREALARRLERRANAMRVQLKNCNGDREELFYHLIMQYCGMKVNNDPFLWLAQITPLSLLTEFHDDLHSAEALLFGQAGMLLENVQLTLTDDLSYYCSLREVYRSLLRSYSLQPINPIAWKYMRLRPNNFPDVRIAQLAKYFSQEESMCAKVMSCKALEELRSMFKAEASEYWDTHYRFHVQSRRYKKTFGEQMLNGLLINVVIPLRYMQDAMIDEKIALNIAEEMLKQIPAEKNAVVEKLALKFGLYTQNAAMTQSLLELSR